MLGFNALVSSGIAAGGGIDVPVRQIGSGISGGYYSRGRWRRLGIELREADLALAREQRRKLDEQKRQRDEELKWKKYVEENRPFSREKFAKLEKELLAKKEETERQLKLERERQQKRQQERQRLAEERIFREFIAPIQERERALELELERQRSEEAKWKKYVEETRPFSRAKWDQIQRELLAQRQETERQLKLEREREQKLRRELKRLANEKALQDYTAPIKSLGAGAAERARQLALVNAMHTVHAARVLNQQALEQTYRLRIARQAAEDREDEEAIALLARLISED